MSLDYSTMPQFSNVRPVLDSVEACDADFENLFGHVRSYARGADLEPLRRAYRLSRERHSGQKRASGKPYLVHPLEVAWILSGLEQDVSTLCAAVLHDCVEDTETTREEILSGFGDEVALLVEGVTKLDSLEYESKQLELAENIRKMMVATARDVRVLLLKLADRLHNMRTLEHLDEERRDRMSRETMELYAPLANRLGIQPLKSELEDLAFRFLNPEEYKNIVHALATSRRTRERTIDEVSRIIVKTLSDRGVEARVYGRPKHVYSIYQKMQRQKIPFEGIYDVTAFRVIVDTEPRCWEVLGVIHGTWTPVPNRFRDYLSLPKSNGYRSLHTTVMGPKSEMMEVQIRTDEMHRIAEDGVAAHWRYKEGGHAPRPEDVKMFTWLRSILEYGRDVKDSAEFMETAVGELFAGEVYVFTPAGAVLSFPRGSTPVDFAYAIHTNVGHRCAGAKVNGVMVPLSYKLRSGDKIEILTRPNQHPSSGWLEFVRTSRARAKIRSYVRQEERKRSIELGRDVLEKRFRERGQSLSRIEKKGDLRDLLAHFKVTSRDELYSRVGTGRLHGRDVVQYMFPDEEGEQDRAGMRAETAAREEERRAARQHTGGVKVGDVDDILIRMAKCCNPVPGDPIVGFITRGRGVTVHRRDCPRTMELDPERKIDVRWELAPGVLHPVRLRVVCQDRPGILSRLSQPYSAAGVNIDSLRVEPLGDGSSACIFSFKVSHLSELTDLIRTLEKVNGVYSVERV
jgi:GTP pyrophosphokinase